MKIDKYIKDLSRRVEGLSNGNKGNGGNAGNYDHDDSYGLYRHDDEYYLDRGSEPPRFAYYRHIRAEEWKALGPKPRDHEYDSRITRDELDFILKRNLRIPPEERYQREKTHYYFHELYIEGGRECNPALGGCTPKCRFYNEYGRIEDKEVIEMYRQLEG